jgi:hypothetical protein
VHLETKLSGWPTVRRRIATEFVRMQIWIFDPKIRPLDDAQYARMGEQFRTNSIPLHAILAPDGTPNGRTLETLKYRPDLTEADYLAFLEKGLAGMKKD